MADAARRAGDSGPERPDVAARALGGPWPASAQLDASGLRIGGKSAADLADRYGTPLLVVDEADLRDRCRQVRALFPHALYAVKAFTSHAVIGIVLDEGLDLLTATGGEVEACLRAGAPATRIVMHGSNKSDAELELAVRAGLSLVVADGPAELGRLDAAARAQGRVQPVLLRIVPEVPVQTHEAIATGHEASKFGTPLPEAAEAVALAASLAGLRFDGLHAHAGSQVLEIAPYLRVVDVLIELAARVRDEHRVSVRVLDIGGGFGVTYVAERQLNLGELASTVASHLIEACAARDLTAPQLVVEPGRAIVANTAVTLYRVGTRKRVAGRTLIAVDGGMSDNLRPMLYDARYAVVVAGPAVAPMTESCTVVGRHCESGDVLAEDVELPEGTGPGDLLAFAATGAYTYSLASTYNRVGRPAVVAVREGASTLWLRREDAGDLDRLETAAHRAAPATTPPLGITIRPARSGDARSFLALWTAVVEEGRYVRSERVSHPLRVYRARFRRSWTDHEAQVVALDGDRVVGHIFLQRERHPVTRHVATLGIAVAADHRGKGVGSSLLAEGLRWARNVGVEKVVLSVYAHNTGAIALYRKLGFVEEGRLARQSRKSYGYEDEILMAAWVARGEG